MNCFLAQIGSIMMPRRLSILHVEELECRDLLSPSLIQVPDITGPYVTGAGFPNDTSTGTFDTCTVAFNEPILASSIVLADIKITGPNGEITPTAVQVPAEISGYVCYITLPVQSAVGIYTITLKPSILDLAGNPLDQNQNGINGETVGDQFTGTGTFGTPDVPPILAVGDIGGAVRIVNASSGAVISTFRPLSAGDVQYTGLVEVALGDFSGDGVPDVAVAAADPLGVNGLNASKVGQVFVYDGAALAAGIIPTMPFHTFFVPFEHDGPDGISYGYTNGLNIAAGDVNGDGFTDLIAGTRGGNGTTSGRREYGRLVVISGNPPADASDILGGIQTPFGANYQKSVVVAAGNIDGIGGDEIAVTRGGPVASPDPTVQQIKVKVFQLQGTPFDYGAPLNEIHLSADGSTAFAPFASLNGPASAINRDGRVAFVDSNGDGKAELVFSALDPLTTPGNGQVRVAVYSIDVAALRGAATIVSTGHEGGTYLMGNAVVDHAITHVPATGAQQNLALITESSSSGIVYLAPLIGSVQSGGFGLRVLHGGITIDGI